MIEYIPTPLLASTALTPWDPSTQCKGLGSILGTIIGVVATIAVPFLAPVIGSALGGGFFASVVGQALIGAGIGAVGGGVGAAVSGGSILQGALLGGAGGGIAGGAGAFFGGAGLTTGAGTTAGATEAAGQGAGSSFLYGTPGTLTGDAGLAGSSAFYGSAGTVPTAGLAPPTAGVGATGALANPTSIAPAAGAVPGSVAATSGVTGTVGGGLSTAFKTAAIQSVMAGGMQALKALAPDQQGALLDQMKQEMAVTQGQDAAAYQQQLKIFNDYYSYAKSINPEYFSQLERNNEAQRLAQVANAGERQMRGSGYGAATIAAERRRNEVEGVAGLNTAGTNGYMRGLQAKDAAYQTASSLYPKSQPTRMYDLQNMYQDAGARSADETAGVAGILAPWQIYAQQKLGVLDNSRTA